MRLIEADALFKAIKSDKIAWRFGVPNTLELLFDYLRIIIKEQPTIEVEPVRHGRWDRYSNDKFVGYDRDGKLKYRKVYKYECSRCLCETAVKSNYCPNCGAKMDGGKDDG